MGIFFIFFFLFFTFSHLNFCFVATSLDAKRHSSFSNWELVNNGLRLGSLVDTSSKTMTMIMTVTACKKDKHQQKYLKSEQFLDEKDTEKVMSSINQGLGRAMPLSSWGLWKLRSRFKGTVYHMILFIC